MFGMETTMLGEPFGRLRLFPTNKQVLDGKMRARSGRRLYASGRRRERPPRTWNTVVKT